MATFLDPIVAITPAVKDSWQSVDLSAYCPAGTTGVVFKVVNATGTAEAIGWRKNGSADNRISDMDDNNHIWAACGIDANRVLQLYVGDNIVVSLVGYFGSEAVFFTNAVDKSFATTGSWQDVDISGSLVAGDTAQLAFLDIRGLASHSFGLRANGSTDDITNANTGARGGFVGVDGNGIFECYIASTANDIFLNGYLKAGATIGTNYTNVTPGSGGSYVDLAALPAGAIAGVYQTWTSSTLYKNALRCNGASEDDYTTLNRHTWAIVKCDASRVIEAKVSSTGSCRIYLLGYLTDPTPTITTLTPDHAGIDDSVTITGTQFGAAQGSGSVTVNGTAATVVSWADTEIVITVPHGATDGNVVVTTGGGLVTGGAALIVEDPAPATIETGCPGDNVIITGAYFGAADGSVDFGGLAASVVSWSTTEIVATIPDGATDCNVTVTHDGRSGTIAFTLGDCGSGGSGQTIAETPIHTGNPIGAAANLGLSPVR